jgi:hypothetical protein
MAAGTAGQQAAWAHNGRTWRLQHIPTLPGAGLNAVSCVSETDCVAVGASTAGTLAERWNGEGWTIQATPNPPGSASGGFTGVACTSASFCVAVGFGLDSAGNPVATLAERWNGKRWAIQPTPNPAPASGFGGVTCTSASFCVAVGGGPVDRRTLAERWNGRSWAIQHTPNPSQGGGLAAVSCTSTVACTAAADLGAAMRWNGAKWTIQPTPSTGSPGSRFNTVACTSATSCTAAGELTDSSGNAFFGTLAERWNGRSWRIQPTPVLPGLGLVNNFLPHPIDLHRGRRVRKRRPRREDTDRSVAGRDARRPTRAGRLLAQRISRHGWLHPHSHGRRLRDRDYRNQYRTED